MVRVKAQFSSWSSESTSSSNFPVSFHLHSPCENPSRVTTRSSFSTPLRSSPQYVWLPTTDTKDVHAAFRFTFSTSSPNTSITIRHVGVTWYNMWLDEQLLAEGPTRFQGTPMYDEVTTVVASTGVHVIAVQVHSAGVQTRLQLLSSPCLYLDVSGNCQVEKYVCRALTNYVNQWQRISGLLGWAENCTLDATLLSWKQINFDDSSWASPVAVTSFPDPVPLSNLASPAASIDGALVLLGSGQLVERYGYVDDDPAARFALRALTETKNMDYGPPQGVWWRFDAGACRLLRPVFTVQAKPGTVFEICYSQALIDGKASPYHPLCSTPSCYMDRYAIGDSLSATQSIVICPLEPRGCRYIELHAVCDDNVEDVSSVKLVAYKALFRGYKPYLSSPATGQFACADALLVKVWQTGVLSTNVCVEDSCIDGPCRERGQWTGDSLAVTLPNLMFAFDDIFPIALCLMQTSDSADANGVVSGNCPNNVYLIDYAFIWVEGAMKFFSATANKSLADIFKTRAARQLDYFLSSSCFTPSVGFTPPSDYGFVIDWGYTDNGAFAPLNMCLNALLVSALASMVALCEGLGDAALAQKYDAARMNLVSLLKQAIGIGEEKKEDCDAKQNTKRNATHSTASPAASASDKQDDDSEWIHVNERVFDPSKLGFHAAALCLRAGLLAGYEVPTVTFLKSTLTSMFPINPNAPRLSDPGKRSATGFYTPYFQTFCFEALFRCGEVDFVLDQYRQAWGWALTQSSTWLEVFDPRWEAVHSWGGCPTWQMSQFLLGFFPRFDMGVRFFDFSLKPGYLLAQCSGTVPTRDLSMPLTVTWQRLTQSTVQLKVIVTKADIHVRGWPTSPTDWFTLSPGSYTVKIQV